MPVQEIETPETYKKRYIHRPYNGRTPGRRGRFWLTYLVPGALILACVLLAWSALFRNPDKIERSEAREIVPSMHYDVSGQPTIDAATINNVLQRYHSPASGLGQVLYEQGLHYHIDPVYALAFFMEESTFGTRGVARVTHSLGNVRATPGHCNYQGYRCYKTWQDGSNDWYHLITQLYIKQWRLHTVEQIIPAYAPNRDHNNETAYIYNVKLAVDTWRSGLIVV